MKNPVLRLLFDYKGSIDGKGFRIGITVLFFISACFIVATFRSFASTRIITMHSSGFYYYFNNYNLLLSGLFPEILPLRFMLFYSSFVLAIKRMRSLGLSTASGIATGLLTYLFFAVISSSPSIISYFFIDIMEHAEMEFIQIVISLLGIIFFMGLVMVLILSFQKANSTPENQKAKIGLSFSPSFKLDQFGYLHYLGWLMWFGFAMALVIGFGAGVLHATNLASRSSIAIVIIVSIVFVLILTVLYCLMNARRLNDIGLPGYLFILVLIFYLLVEAVSVYLQYKIDLVSLVFLIGCIQKIGYLVFLASQFLLIIMPSRLEVNES